MDNPYQLELAELNWQAGDIPFARDFADIYFSPSEGLAETRYVFLQHNQLAERWRALPEHTGAGKRCFTIAETGFGTGLNFLATWQLWQQCAPSGWQLQFISTEKHPLSPADLRRALSAWPELATQAELLLQQYPVLVPGHHYLPFAADNVCLHLLLGDATDSLQQLCASHRLELPLGNHWQVDAWFLDGFAPAKNPSLWTNELFQHITRLSGPGTTVATFTAVGEVRRGLIRNGFAMRKTKGFGSKREMLCGQFEALPAFTAKRQKGVQAPWYHCAGTAKRPRHIAVIGAGLAGCHSANALARRGFQVTLIDAAEHLASGASGNPQGMLYTKLSPQAGTLNLFTLASYLFALRHYQQLPADTTLQASCGVLQLAYNDKEQQLLLELQRTFAAQPELVQCVDAEQASRLAGIPIQLPGWFYPRAGWLSPPALCKLLADHPLITQRLACPVTALAYNDNAQWQLLDSAGQCLVTADAVILANSHAAARFTQAAHLPLKCIRGQITQLPANPTSAALKTVICHEGYLTPAIDGQHHLGATFDLHDTQTDLRANDHQRNLDSLDAALPGLFAPQATESLPGRAGLRCASPDYLPIVGPAPDYQAFTTDYAVLRKNAHQRIDTPGRYLPGLYLNLAHGSRGLTSTPLCAELLASQINAEPPPLGNTLLQALHPARFIIRDLIRNKI